MNKKYFEEMLLYYNRLKEEVHQLSLTPEQQIMKLKGTCIVDELALDYCNIGMQYAEKLYSEGWITSEIYELAKSIKNDFDVMNCCKYLWTEEALLNSNEWEVCRNKGKKLLSMLDKWI